MTVFHQMMWTLNYSVEYDLCKSFIRAAKTDKDILMFCIGSVKRKCFLRCYMLFSPIEELQESEKKELKDFVIKSFPGRSVEELIENCKIIYTAGQLSS